MGGCCVAAKRLTAIKYPNARTRASGLFLGEQPIPPGCQRLAVIAIASLWKPSEDTTGLIMLEQNDTTSDILPLAGSVSAFG